MYPNELCITVPEDLRCYKKSSDYFCEQKNNYEYISEIKIIRNQSEQIESVEYYENGELVKSVIYKTSSVIANRYFKFGYLYLEEEFSSYPKVSSKSFYKKDGNLSFRIEYEYNRQDKITGIKKLKNNTEYLVKYGYDELDRVNSRKIYVNSDLLCEQKYRYDILDRVVEYRDANQTISINQISTQGELISYKIIDRIGNEIIVNNLFSKNGYSCTKVTVNGYSSNIKDESYVDNIMLKKPYTTEDDLDLIISQLLKPANINNRTERNDVVDKNVDSIIEKNIEYKTLPISIRKRILFNICQNERNIV